MNLINVTLGSFNPQFFEFFVKRGNRYVANVRAVKTLIDIVETFGHFSVAIRLSENGEVGTWKDGRYSGGINEMFQNKEADFSNLLVPTDIRDPPGQFVATPIERGYYIGSITKSLQAFERSALQSLYFMDMPSMITFAVLFSILHHLNKKLDYSSIKRMCSYKLFIALESFLILFISSCFNSAFSTGVLIGIPDEIVDSLDDIIKYDRAPYFTEGESMYELFRFPQTEIHAKVFEVARKHGTETPIPLDVNELVDEMKETNVFLGSEQIFMIGLPVLNHIIRTTGMSKPLHRSTKPYNSHILGYMISPVDSKYSDEIHRRFKNVFSRMTCSGIALNIWNRLPKDALDVFTVFQIEHKDLFFIDSTQSDHKTIKPLTFGNLRDLIILSSTSYCIALLIFLVEKLKTIK